MIKPNTKVKTPYGLGVVIEIDLPRSKAWRYVVKLDKPHVPNPAAFFPKEVKPL